MFDWVGNSAYRDPTDPGRLPSGPASSCTYGCPAGDQVGTKLRVAAELVGVDGISGRRRSPPLPDRRACARLVRSVRLARPGLAALGALLAVGLAAVAGSAR